MTELVSILIPCYNAEKWLKETIESALSQTWPNKEIIIVDDGSTDNSLMIASQYESNLVKVISQENKGAPAAQEIRHLNMLVEIIFNGSMQMISWPLTKSRNKWKRPIALETRKYC